MLGTISWVYDRKNDMKYLIPVILGAIVALTLSQMDLRDEIKKLRLDQDKNYQYKITETCQGLAALTQNPAWKYQTCLKELKESLKENTSAKLI